MFLLAIVIAGLVRTNSPQPRCVGEFEAVRATGVDGVEYETCELTANFGDKDEPMASDPGCAKGFVCNGECHATAHAYAECSTHHDFRRVHILHAACNITGTWDCGGVTCTVTETSPTSMTATNNVTGFLWNKGVGTGPIQPGGAIAMVYTLTKGGERLGRNGTLNADCRSFLWNDSSVWSKWEAYDVHVVAHTHDDTGYLSTVDEYYESNVRSILTTVVEELQKNSARKFTYVETAFFAMWWAEQTEATKVRVCMTGEDGRAGSEWLVRYPARPLPTSACCRH